ncbi:unnamed protein product [Trifolium pratense]|uniref:Uncharacterized protein n=1 Tax=Trifolium pratense TaxID=57577 RepID=A0ACB0K998_TRIPR|nr:unnamed protein product [Trifolium pratense]
MKTRQKSYVQKTSAMLQGQEDQNDMEPLQVQLHQSINNQLDEQFEESLLIKVKDTYSGEIIIQKLVASEVWFLEKTKKVLVEINGNGQGNDNGANLLVRFLGELAKKSEFCPISIERWDMMSEESIKAQWKNIEDRFEFDYAAGIKWVKTTLGDRWKYYKYRLRCKHFKPNKSKEDILANPPSGVPPVDWIAFVNYYNNDEMKKVSERNTRNRKKLKVIHAGGSKSNARRGRQMELQLDRPICRGEVYLSTLRKKSGDYVNDEGKAVADKILQHLPQDQERVATLGVPSKINAYPDDAIGKVHGAEHSGRVRGIGVGASSTEVFETRKNFAKIVNVGAASQNNAEDLHKYVCALEEKLNGYEEIKEQLAQTKEELLETQIELANLRSFLQRKFGDELAIFIQEGMIETWIKSWALAVGLKPKVWRVYTRKKKKHDVSNGGEERRCVHEKHESVLYMWLEGMRKNH